MPPSRAKNLTGALADKIRREVDRADIGCLNTYDVWFILGVMQDWLRENDAALTSSGVKRFRR